MLGNNANHLTYIESNSKVKDMCTQKNIVFIYFHIFFDENILKNDQKKCRNLIQGMP